MKLQCGEKCGKFLDIFIARVVWELMRVEKREFYESFLNFYVLVKQGQELHGSWQVRVCIRVFSTLMSWSNDNKSCMRVDDSWQARVCVRVFLLSYPSQTRTRLTWESMKVEKREFVWEFSQLSSPGQTTTRVAWELIRVDKRRLYESFSTFMSWWNQNKSYMRVDQCWHCESSLKKRTIRVKMRFIPTAIRHSTENI